MAVIEKQTTINASVEKVFAYLADFPRHSEWASHRIRIEQTSQGPISVGSTYRSGHVGKEPRDQVTITEFVPNQRISFESLAPEGRFRHHFVLQPEAGQTRLVKGFEALKLSLMAKLMLPLLLVLGPRFVEKDVMNIKARLES